MPSINTNPLTLVTLVGPARPAPGTSLPTPPGQHADPRGSQARDVPAAGLPTGQGDGNTATEAPDDKESHAPERHITGKVYALKDGSGYAALASDGHYYRVEGGPGHELTFSSSEGYVPDSMVNVTGGPVSRVALTTPQQAAQGEPEPNGLRGSAKPQDDPLTGKESATAAALAAMPGAHTVIENNKDAAAGSRTAHALIIEHPDSALRSQANLSAEAALALLR